MVEIRESPYEPGCYFVGQHQWKIPPRYKLLKVLGSGSFSYVCLAEDREANEQVAIKFIPDVNSSAEYIKRVLREVCILRRISHPGIIQLKGAFVQPSSTGPKRCVGGKLVAASIDLYLVMEYVSGGDLFSMKGQLTEKNVKSLLTQLLLAVQYLHSINVWHRDLKSANILITNRDGALMIKICDFGSARSRTRQSSGRDHPSLDIDVLKKRRRMTNPLPSQDSFSADSQDSSKGHPQLSDLRVAGNAETGLQTPLTRTVATPCYRAPEVIMSRGTYTSAIDMWSVGCIFGELLQRVVTTGGNITPSLQVAPLFSVTWDTPLTPKPGMRYVDPVVGDTAIHRELETLFDTVGTPAWACIETVPSKEWRDYLRGLPGRAPKLQRRFPHASEESLDLLARLLTFEPSRRASSEEALCHEYLEGLVGIEEPEAEEAGLQGTAARSRLSGLGSREQPMDIADLLPQRSRAVRRSGSAHRAVQMLQVEPAATMMPVDVECASPTSPASGVLARQMSGIVIGGGEQRPLPSAVGQNHWEESNPARALELLELAIDCIYEQESQAGQTEALRGMLEAEVEGLQKHGIAMHCPVEKTIQENKFNATLPRSISWSNVAENSLQMDDGRNMDSSLIGRERLNKCADITTAHLDAEAHLGAGRHGEWSGSNTGGEASRGSGTGGGWGISTLPPGMPANSAQAAAYFKAISAQQAR